MEFFNKKQDVIDVQLTGYGKQLLSRGLFKPMYYAFSDDGVVYDSRWITGSGADPQQSDIESRIQEETPRLKTQNRKIGAEKSVFLSSDSNILLNQIKQLGALLEVEVSPVVDYQEYLQLIEKANAKFDFAESEKLLEGLLGTKSFLNSNNPAWNALFFHGDIKNSTSYYKKNNTPYINIPQINCTLKDVGYRINGIYDPYEVLSKPKNTLDGIKAKSDKFSNINMSSFFEDKTVSGYKVTNILGEEFGTDPGILFIEKDFVFLSLEEANVDFTKENFTIEIFEVTTTSDTDDGEEELVKMAFKDDSKSIKDGLLINNVFDIEVDEEISEEIACYLIGKDKSLKDQSIFIGNIFDCDSPTTDENVFINPYDSLPEVTTGDTC